MKKTTGREYFYSVSGLMIPKYKVSATLASDIDHFIDWLPKNTGNLETYSQISMPKFVAVMEELYTLLCSIHAHWLEMEASRILRLAEIDKGELCRNFIVPFISNLNTLAIDIQTAQNKGHTTDGLQRSKIERYRNVISGMRVIDILLDNSEYDKALDIATSMDEIHDGEYYLPLVVNITSENQESAKKLTEEIISVYTQKINEATSRDASESISLKRILIVDDMPEILTALSIMLKDQYQIFALTSGQQALDFIDSKQQPDAFILDIEMPVMNGFMLARKIRARKKYFDTPILFLTSNGTRETVLRSLEFNIDAFIVKPLDKGIILTKLNNCFS